VFDRPLADCPTNGFALFLKLTDLARLAQYLRSEPEEIAEPGSSFPIGVSRVALDRIAEIGPNQLAPKLSWRRACNKLRLPVELYRGLRVELARRQPNSRPKLMLSAAEVTDAFQQLAQAPSVIVRQYRQIGVDGAAKRFSEEAQIMGAHGYVPATQSFNAVHVFGPGTGSGFLTVSYVRRDSIAGQSAVSTQPTPVASSPAATPSAKPTVGPVASAGDRLRQLAALKDDGIISAEEFEAKKAELLRQL
jgi:hypothetical protein